MTDALADHLREHGVRSTRGPVAPAAAPPCAGPTRQIVCEVCGQLANRGARARYCSPACKAIARAMRYSS